MKKGILLGLVCVFILCMAGCGGKEETPENKRSLEDIYNEMTAKVELPEMLCMEEDYITNYYGADISTFEEYVFAAAEDALLAETIILVRLKEGEDKENVKKLMENLIKQKKTELQNYLPEQYQIVEKSEIASSGSYIWLIISSKQEELKEIVASYLK